MLVKLLPTQKPALDTAYQAALAKLPQGKSRKSGIAAGRKSAAAILAIRQMDLSEAADDYRLPTMPEVNPPKSNLTITGKCNKIIVAINDNDFRKDVMS